MDAGTDARPGAGRYQRHRPEQTLLYQLVEQYYPCFVEQLAVEGRSLPNGFPGSDRSNFLNKQRKIIDIDCFSGLKRVFALRNGPSKVHSGF